MIWNGCELLAACSGVGQLIILCTATYTVFRHWGNTFAEATASAMISSLMIFSFLFQISFIAGIPILSNIFEWGIFISSSIVIFKHRHFLKQGYKNILLFLSKYPFISFLFITSWIYLFSLTLFFPQDLIHWNEFFHVLLYQHQETFFPSIKSHLAANFNPPLNPVNSLIMSHLFLDKNTELGIGILGFMAYLSIGFSTYALARRYSWPSTALIVTLVVMSMPRLIYMSTSPGFEIIPAATALFCILMIYRGIEQPNIKSLCLFFLGLFFMISKDPMSLIFPIILLPLAVVVLCRRHGVMAWFHLVSQYKWIILSMILPMFIFSQLWLFIYYIIHSGSWFGSIESIGFSLNHDGIQGAVVNMTRYLLEMAHFTSSIDHLSQWLVGFRITGFIQGLYDLFIFPVFGNQGSTDLFKIQWVPNEKYSWFGPFGFILVLPAIGYSLKLAPRRLKTATVALLFYFFLISLIAAWSPSNVRFFSIFFSCSGFCMAFSLPPWRLTRLGKRVITAASMFLLFNACIYHFNGPYPGESDFIPPNKHSVQLQDSTWATSMVNKRKRRMCRHVFGDDRIRIMKSLIPPGSKLGLIFSEPELAYPFVKNLRDMKWIFFQKRTTHLKELKNIHKLDYLILVDHVISEPPGDVQIKIIWGSDPINSKKPGMLVQIIQQ